MKLRKTPDMSQRTIWNQKRIVHESRSTGREDLIVAKKKRNRKVNSDPPPSTICDSCIHAYGDDCFGVPSEERHWVLEVKSRPSAYNYTIRNVRKCSRYERGRKPLPGLSPNIREMFEMAYSDIPVI